MNFKEAICEKQFAYIPSRLRKIVDDADTFCFNHFGKFLTITRVLDKIDTHESGVHQAGRAVDCRNEFTTSVPGRNSRIFTDEEISTLLDYINIKYPRKDNKAVLIHHKVPGSTYHLHFQTPIEWGCANIPKNLIP